MQEYTDKKELENWQPYAYWLGNISGVGYKTAKKLLDAFQTPMEIFHAKETALQQVVNSRVAEAVMEAKKQDVHRTYEEMIRKNISFFPFYHPEYAKRLKEIPDAPYALYVKGNLPRDEQRSVAIVGARSCSAYGRFVAESFAAELAGRNIQIISGLAEGVDGISQSAAIRAGGKTYGVLGCGPDICYPACHKELYEQVVENGGIISIYPPGTKPQPGLFPKRNRIISGLSDVVVVVEARVKSGTLITVDMALEQGREVYVVPGRITDRLSDGCNRLLAQGAGVALSPAQLIKEMEESVWGKEREKEKQQERGTDGTENKKLSEEEKELLALLDFYPISLDRIYMLTQESLSLCQLNLMQVMERLLSLSMEGYVSTDGSYYMLNKPVS